MSAISLWTITRVEQISAHGTSIEQRGDWASLEEAPERRHTQGGHRFYTHLQLLPDLEEAEDTKEV